MSERSRVPVVKVAAEFLAIFAGVSLALLADEWRDYRNDRREERVALSEILSDLGADSIALQAHLRSFERQSRGALWIWKHQRVDVPRDSASHALEQVFRYNLYQPVRAAYLGSRDSGRLALIRDGDLRRQIVDYYEAAHPWIQQFEARYWSAREEFYAAVFGQIRSVPDLTAETYRFDHLEFPLAWRELSSRSDFEYRLSEFGSHVWVLTEQLPRVIDFNSDLQEEVRALLR